MYMYCTLSLSPSSPSLQFVPNEEFLQILFKCIQEISQHLRVALAPPYNLHIPMIKALLEMTMQIRISHSHQNVIALLQKVRQHMLNMQGTKCTVCIRTELHQNSYHPQIVATCMHEWNVIHVAKIAKYGNRWPWLDSKLAMVQCKSTYCPIASYMYFHRRVGG